MRGFRDVLLKCRSQLLLTFNKETINFGRYTIQTFLFCNPNQYSLIRIGELSRNHVLGLTISLVCMTNASGKCVHEVLNVSSTCPQRVRVAPQKLEPPSSRGAPEIHILFHTIFYLSQFKCLSPPVISRFVGCRLEYNYSSSTSRWKLLNYLGDIFELLDLSLIE